MLHKTIDKTYSVDIAPEADNADSLYSVDSLFTEHFSGPVNAIGQLCVCVCISK